MAYSTNPYAPRARREAINLVLLHGFTAASAARKTGVHRSTIGRWLKKSHELGLHGNAFVPTLSSRPHRHPKQLTSDIIARILELRMQLNRCAEVLHAVLQAEGVFVSLSSVGRVLARHNQLGGRPSYKRKLRPARTPRPKAERPGDFLQLDTIHFAHWKTKERYYVYTLIDLKSRWTYAEYSPRISPDESAKFVQRARRRAPFALTLIQTDNGQEFSRGFEQQLAAMNITQRRIRLGKKNDNAHIERFNRTLQDECLGRWPAVAGIQARLAAYLDFYNNHRLHLGLQCMTPAGVLQRY